MTNRPIIVGDRRAELQAFQLLTLALSEQARRLGAARPQDPRARAVSALLYAAARAMSLPSCAGLDTPIEVLALAARNAFELWLRLIHMGANEANHQAWRDEALTDQLQVLEGILRLEGDEPAKVKIRDEIERVRKHGDQRALNSGVRPRMAGDLAREVGHATEYGAFYKLYSKLVHPSSWSVNWPEASTSDMYRAVLIVNGQAYGWQILEAGERLWGVPVAGCYDAARASMAIELSKGSGALPSDR